MDNEKGKIRMSGRKIFSAIVMANRRALSTERTKPLASKFEVHSPELTLESLRFGVMKAGSQSNCCS